MKDINSYSQKQLLAGIGNTVRKVRQDSGMLQSELAQRSGLSQFSISQIENGRNTSVQSLISILTAMDRLDIIETMIDNNAPKRVVAGYGLGQPISEVLCDSATMPYIDWTEFDSIARSENTTRECLLQKVIDIFVSARRIDKPLGFMKYKGIAASVTDEDIENDLRLRRMFAR